MVDFIISDPVTLLTGMVSVIFSATDGEYTLNDAIVVRQAQYETMSPTDIQAEAERRWVEWISIVNPPEESING